MASADLCFGARLGRGGGRRGVGAVGEIARWTFVVNALKYHCPCCGYGGMDLPAYEHIGSPPWADHGSPPYALRYGSPSYDCCDCCGFEFGFDDEPGAGEGQSFSEYLWRRAAGGCLWFSADRRPAGWSLITQLTDVGVDVSNLPLTLPLNSHPRLYGESKR